MGERTGIAWSDATWNPIRGCSRVSEGCRHCYAERVAGRFRREGQPYHGLVKAHETLSTGEIEMRWTGEVRWVEEALTLPLRWRRPRCIFVNSMSDLFHEMVPDEWIARVFAVMLLAPRHYFQVLTKRPERMATLLNKPAFDAHVESQAYALSRENAPDLLTYESIQKVGIKWPLPHAHLGVSVEDQPTADARIPLLLQTPAAVRIVSYEPALAPVEFLGSWHDWLRGWTTEPEHAGDGSCRDGQHQNCPQPVQVHTEKIDWLIVGGESGPGARPCDVAWIRSAVAQCKAAGVPVFVKQLGARSGELSDPQEGYATTPRPWIPLKLRHRAGADPAEWPEDLRVQEWPR